MDIVVLSHAEVSRLLPMGECVEAMTEALIALSRGEVYNPLRFVVRPASAKHLLGLMPAYREGEAPAYALKEVCIFPANPQRGLDSHQGAVLLHSAETGELLAVMNASAITAIRTAAVSAVATRALARPDSRVAALIGTGHQARAHLDALAALARFDSVRVAGRTPERAQAFVAELESTHPFLLEPAATVQDAVAGADVVMTTTNAAEPILRRAWLAPGAHVNAVGSSIPTTRELDSETMAAAALFVDRRESTLNESGDYLLAAREAHFGPEHIRAELGDVLAGKERGRLSPSELTVFKSLGLAVEDLAAAQHLYAKAVASGDGSRVPFS